MTWEVVAGRFEAIYERVARTQKTGVSLHTPQPRGRIAHLTR
jgi:hypothetical protein